MSNSKHNKKKKVVTAHVPDFDQRLASLEEAVQYLMDSDAKRNKLLDRLKEKLR